MCIHLFLNLIGSAPCRTLSRRLVPSLQVPGGEARSDASTGECQGPGGFSAFAFTPISANVNPVREPDVVLLLQKPF